VYGENGYYRRTSRYDRFKARGASDAFAGKAGRAVRNAFAADWFIRDDKTPGACGGLFERRKTRNRCRSADGKENPH
jgi:hypothetical protein